ncbi:MAG: outer membrane beta-barrel protein [Hyphomicrobiaceae bacterium]|nr:outer membrane beta-barrel protein [Hyphomicrobiaceae bacterium]
MIHHARRLLAVLAALWLCAIDTGWPLVSSASAQTNELSKRESRGDDDRSERAASGAAAGGITVGGITISPTVDIAGGYDSNLDASSDAQGSWFTRTAAEIDIAREHATGSASFFIAGTGYKYDDLDIGPRRFELESRLQVTENLNEAEELRFTAGHVRDALGIDRADIFEGEARYKYTTPALQAWARGRSYTQVELGSASGADEDIEDGDIFDLGRDEPPSYSKSSFQAAVIPRPRDPFTVFAIGGYARVAFFDQGEAPALDRRADDLFAIAGVRLNVSERLRIEPGWRVNHRAFADRDVVSDTTDGPDLRVQWVPVDGVEIVGKVQRIFEETTSVFAIVDDVTIYSVGLEWDVTTRLSLRADAIYEREKPVADSVLYDEYELELGLVYKPGDKVEWFAEGLAKYVEERTTSDAYERFRGLAGVRLVY